MEKSALRMYACRGGKHLFTMRMCASSVSSGNYTKELPMIHAATNTTAT